MVLSYSKMASDWICIVNKVPSKQVADHIKLKALNSLHVCDKHLRMYLLQNRFFFPP